ATVRDEWLAYGLSTEPANRAEAEAGVRAAYEAAGLDAPKFMIWVGSPWAGAVAQAIAPQIIEKMVGDQVGGQVEDQVGGQVGERGGGEDAEAAGGQVGEEVGEQVGAQVGEQVRD